MKSSIRKSTFKAIYRLLDKVSPIDGDCGRLCSRACCDNERALAASPGAQFGMYLLPGEEKLFARDEPWLTWTTERAEDYDYPDSWHGDVYFAQCKSADDCDRAMRPIQCRTFPLAPYIDSHGAARLILSPEKLPYICPLIGERYPLNKSFLKATHTVWKRLLKDPLIYDLIKKESERWNTRALDFIV